MVNWKKELKSWGIMLGILGILYFTGWITPIAGTIQSVILSTGLFNPDTDKNEKANHGFIYQGQLKDRNGKLIDLKDYKGKTLFINLWATWCAPCRAEMPHIASLYEKVKDQENLEFLMLALDDDFNKSEKYVDAEGFGFPVFQAIGRISPSLHSQSIPTTLVVNKEGKIVFYREGMSNFDTVEFREFLTKL
ncbi:TlpA family protein disulfide reductase [Echinicola jeungdonensis]|uniref:TlpA family protein disulfide reductase n=1 Tax=Echinicola jeungdonensis TaxID=709343 RepID=A0ABV5J2B7_9BACT